MAFKMRSGNKVSFKNMGSSPVKQKENLPRDPGDRGTEVKWDNVRQEYIPINTPNAKSPSTPQPTGPKPISPTKQKLNKGGEGQDQDKIFNNKGEHIGDYVNDKPVMRPGFKRPVVKKDAPVKPKEGDMRKYSDLEKYDDDNPTGKAEPPKKKKSPAKQAKQKGLGPRTAFGGVKNPELVKTKKTKGKKVMIDGPKKQVTGVKNPGNWQPHPNTFKAKKSTVSKHGQLDDAEIEYQNDLKLLKKMNSSKKKKSPAKQAVELESDSANPGGVHAGESLLGKKRRKEKSQKNAVERSKGETALQGEATKQAELSARERKADKS